MQAVRSLALRSHASLSCRPTPRPLSSFRPLLVNKPTLQRGKVIHRSPAITTQAVPPGQAAAGPEPPFRDDSSADDAQQPLANPAPATSSSKRACESGDESWDYTWLNHPNPYNPFKTRVDENGMYVAPSMQQRQRALEMGLPLYGAMGK